MSADSSAHAPQLQVELRGVRKSFGGVTALHDIDLRIEPGSVHGLVGENGAGKSTLSKIIAGLLAADDGTLLIDGREASFASPREIGRASCRERVCQYV